MKKLLGALVLVLALCLACTAFAADGVIDHSKVAEGQLVNWGDIDSITTIAGHKIGNLVEKTDSTCHSYGKAVFECTETEYGIHQHYVTIAKKDHNWSSESGDTEWGTVIEKPDCQHEGKAQDICLNEGCGATREVYRTIDKTGHEYSKYVYDVFQAPTCTAHGLGQHKCIYCGELNKDEIDKDGKPIKEKMVDLDPIDHEFTDWNILSKGTCEKYGSAERACVVCGMHQIVDGSEDHADVWLNNSEPDVIVMDNLDDLGLSELNKLNVMWIAPEKTEYDTQAEYEDWLNEFNADLDKAAVVTKNWLVDCYTREITLSCPFCGKKTGDAKVHEDIVIKLVAPATIAHVWEKLPTVVKDASCTEPGFKAYYCIHYDTHTKEDPEITEDMSLKDVKELLKGDDYFITSENGLVKKADPRVKIEEIAPKGHTWGPWQVRNTYTKDGVKYVVNVRVCDVCEAVEEELKPLTVEDGKNGLVQDEESGDWYFYEADKLVDETKIVGLEDGEFWIVKGKLAKECMGLVYCADEKFYFLNQGQILRVSEIVEYDGGWFIVKNGELDLDATGLYTYDGGRFLFTAGRLRKDVSGLVEVNGTWYFLANGQVADYTGVAEYDGEFFVIDNGMLDADYNGTIEYDGAEFKVVDGQLYALDAE